MKLQPLKCNPHFLVDNCYSSVYFKYSLAYFKLRWMPNDPRMGWTSASWVTNPSLSGTCSDTALSGATENSWPE